VSKISVFRGEEGSIALVLSQDSIFLTVAGEPIPGISLCPTGARDIALRLLLLAQEIERKPCSLEAPPVDDQQDGYLPGASGI
jgi:hypothetical protein